MEQNQTTWTIHTPTALGVALRSYREAEGLTQSQLATVLGTTRQRLSRIEDGKPTAQVELIFDLLRRLGVTMRLGQDDA
jgi:HTH-type transcriptional regulator/antitoxin HipB